MSERVAFVTGASRGIGKATAIELARAGFDVAIMARTVEEGEPREHSSTAALGRETGRDALIVQGDLLDRASLGAAATTVLDQWGHVDVVVHNARYIGPGHMDRFLDTPIELLEKQIDGNVLAPLVLNKLLLPSMVERGGGTIVNITSASGYADPTKPAGDGGWGMGYGVSKGAFQRVAGFLAVELADQGIRCFNVQPGLIATERIAQDMAKFGIENAGAPPEVVGVVVAWLCTSDEADAYNGTNIEAQYFCHERAMLPGWPGPRSHDNNIRYDRSGAILDDLEAKLARDS